MLPLTVMTWLAVKTMSRARNAAAIAAQPQAQPSAMPKVRAKAAMMKSCTGNMGGMRQATMSPKNATLPRTRSVVWSTTAEFAHQLDFNNRSRKHSRRTTLARNTIAMRTKVLRFRHLDRESASSTNAGGVSYRAEGTASGKRARVRNGIRQRAILRRIRADCSPFKGPLITLGSFPRRALRRRGSNMLLLLLGCCGWASTAPAAASVVSDDVGLRCFSPSAAGLADGPMVLAQVIRAAATPTRLSDAALSKAV